MFELIYPSAPAPVLPEPTAEQPGIVECPGEEMLPVVTESGSVIGQASRTYCHGGSMLLHPVVHLHILNRYDELYLQKRSMKKDLLPGYWDTAVGGHVEYGEFIMEALFRESEEELKLVEYNPIWIGNYVFQSKVERELVNVFAAVGNFSPAPDMDEVECGRFWPMKEIEESLGKSIFTPNFEGEFLRIRKALEALL